jgi:hypothetical protein
MPHIQYGVLSLAVLAAPRPFCGSGAYVTALLSGDPCSMPCQSIFILMMYYCHQNNERARPGDLQTKQRSFVYRRHTAQKISVI